MDNLFFMFGALCISIFEITSRLFDMITQLLGFRHKFEKVFDIYFVKKFKLRSSELFV